MNNFVIVIVIIILIYIISKDNVPNPNINKKTAKVLVLSCIDPRFTESLTYNLSKTIHNDYDLYTLAGASIGALKKGWDNVFIEHVDIALSLHNIQEIWIVDHLDCGMYKNTLDIKTDLDINLHLYYMDKLKTIINEKYSNLTVKEYIIGLNGKLIKY